MNFTANQELKINDLVNKIIMEDDRITHVFREESKYKKESNEYHNDYQKIQSFDDYFKEKEYEEDKIVQNLDNKFV